MADLKGSKTEDNLKAAFAGESQANRRYLYFAQKADVEGYNDVAAVFGEMEEQRPPALEQTGALDVAAEQVGVAAADPFQQRIPLLRRHLDEGRRPR